MDIFFSNVSTHLSNSLTGGFLHSDVREMRNLLSKLRDTMPLPLKNQGAVIFHWWTYQQKYPPLTTTPHPPPPSSCHNGTYSSQAKLEKTLEKGWLWSLFNVYLSLLRPLKTKVIVRISKKCWTDKMAAVSKKRLERPLLVEMSFASPTLNAT